jgi:hypothetical protein
MPPSDGIWVAIMNDEAELPKIGGIPQSIRRYGDSALNYFIMIVSPRVLAMTRCELSALSP